MCVCGCVRVCGVPKCCCSQPCREYTGSVVAASCDGVHENAGPAPRPVPHPHVRERHHVSHVGCGTPSVGTASRQAPCESHPCLRCDATFVSFFHRSAVGRSHPCVYRARPCLQTLRESARFVLLCAFTHVGSRWAHTQVHALTATSLAERVAARRHHAVCTLLGWGRIVRRVPSYCSFLPPPPPPPLCVLTWCVCLRLMQTVAASPEWTTLRSACEMEVRSQHLHLSNIASLCTRPGSTRCVPQPHTSSCTCGSHGLLPCLHPSLT